MSKKFICPSCSAEILYAGGESIFQTCKACNAPVIVPSEFLYEQSEQLASENFASLVNDKPVNVEQVTNELTPGRNLPKDEDSIDPEARIEKFEVYQEKIGTHSIETKKVVDEIVTPKKQVDFKTASPFANKDDSVLLEVPQNVSVKIPEELKVKSKTSKSQEHPVIARVKNELRKGDKIGAIKIFRSRFKTSLSDSKDYVEAIERGENIDVSPFVNQKG